MDVHDYPGRPGGPDDVIRVLRQYMPRILFVLVVVIVLLFAFSMVYSVDASDVGVILRYGQYDRTDEPGLHLKWPWPIESVYFVPIRRVNTIEFGFETEQPGRRTVYAPRDAQQIQVAELLTGDLNLAHVEWIVQYRIKDARDYLFQMGTTEPVGSASIPQGEEDEVNAAVPDTIRDVSESVMRNLVGNTSIDAVITFGREQIAGDAQREIQEMLDGFHAGVDIITVKLQTTAPPEDVKDAFQEVNRARQNKERVVNEAEGERNLRLPAARGHKDQMVLEAEGYADRIVLEAKGQISAFEAKLAEYEKAKEVTKTRLYLDAMEEILAGVGSKTIIDESIQGVLPLLNLDTQPTPPTPAVGSGR